MKVDYHQRIMKDLPSRNSLNNLQNWLCLANERINCIDLNIDSDRPINLKKLDLFKKEIIQLKEEFLNEKEIEFKFCSEIIQNEIKQGFFDLSIQEASVQIRSELDKLKQKIDTSLERIEISILKLNEFNRCISSIKTWIDNKIKQAELEKMTKFKTNFDESTILMDDMENFTSLEEEKTLAKQVVGLHQELNEIRSFWLDDKILNDPLINSLIYEYIIQDLDELKTNLEKIDHFNQVKIQNNFTNLKQTFSSEINELNLRLQNELNFVLNGKMTTLVQYSTSVFNLKNILDDLDLKRSEMTSKLKKFEIDLQSSEFPVIVNMSKNPKVSLDPHIKHSILNNLTNRDLENKAKNIIYQAETDMLKNWKKYDCLLENLSSRLENTREILYQDLSSIECIYTSEDLVAKSSLFEQTVNEMVENSNMFTNLEQFSENLCSLNKNLSAQIVLNKKNVELKLNELSKLIDKLGNKLELTKNEQKNYKKLVDYVEQIILKSQTIIKDNSCFDNLNTRLSTEIKSICFDIESLENELRSKMSDFKSLNIRDSESIERIYHLTSQCSTYLNNLRDVRIKLLDQIQERNYLTEIKLNDLESFLNTIESFIEKKFQNPNEVDDNESLLDRYLNCMKYLQANDLELSKWEICLENLEIEIDESCHKQKILVFKDRIQKSRKFVRLLNSKDGLFDQFLKLKNLYILIESSDFKLTNDEAKLTHLKEEFICLKLKLEKLTYDIKMVDFNFIELNCLQSIEDKLNLCIANFMEKNELERNFKSKLIKIDVKINEIDLKLTSELSEFIKDLSAYEQKLSSLKNLKSIISENDFRLQIDEVQSLAERLQTSHEFQKVKIKYLDLCCEIDKQINKYDYEYNHLKQIVNKSQQLLNLIKESHEDLTKFKINKNEDQIETESELSIEQMINFIKYNISNRLKENEFVKNDILELYSKYTEKTSDKSFDLIKEIVDKLVFEWKIINERCLNKIKKFEIFKTKLVDVERRLNRIREYIQSMESYVRYEMFNNFDLTDMKQILSKKAELENLLGCLVKKDQNTDSVFKQAFYMYKTNKQQLAFISNLKARWDDLKILIRDKILKLSNIWLFLNDQIENFYVILNKTEDFYTNILLHANNLVIDENEIKNFEFSKYTSFFKLIEDLYATINEDNKLIKYLNESFINFSKYVHDFESSQCLEQIREKLLEINSRWDALHNDIAIKIRLVRLS